MMYRNIVFFGVFISLLNPVHAVDNTIKESNRELRNLKQKLLCFKNKEGCSKRQIAGIIIGAASLIAIMSGAE